MVISIGQIWNKLYLEWPEYLTGFIWIIKANKLIQCIPNVI
jgi:hypothetical protein